ncbi:MAG: DUF502 domain-containing protein [Hyphomicrobiales bacterium]|nr:DUF502 domain-containing protein [Hyphomicrobiales bacterium]
MNESPFPKPEVPKKTLLGRLQTYFLTGIVAAVPVIITFYLVFWFIEWVDNWYDAFIPEKYHPESYLPVNIPGLGLIFAAIFFTMLGALTANIIGRSVLKAGERLVARMPVVRAIYSALKQIFEAVFSSEKMSFKKVGIIQYPRPGIYALVFLADQTQGEIPHKLQQDMSTVFVPTTPNPTSGFLLFVPTQDIIILDMGVEDAAKMIVSLGLVMPDPEGRNED